MSRKRPASTEANEGDSTTRDRRRLPTDRSGSASSVRDRRVPPAKGHGPDRGGPRVPGVDRMAGRSSGFRDEARALASRIGDGGPSDDVPDGGPSDGVSPDDASTDDAAGTGSDGGETGSAERGGDDGAGLKDTLQEKFPELDVDAGDLRDVQWRNVVKKIALAEMRNAPGVRGAAAGASELHQQLSKRDPLDGRIAEIHDRLGEFPPPEGWAEAIADRAALAVVARAGRITPTLAGGTEER